MTDQGPLGRRPPGVRQYPAVRPAARAQITDYSAQEARFSHEADENVFHPLTFAVRRRSNEEEEEEEEEEEDWGNSFNHETGHDRNQYRHHHSTCL